MLKRGYNIFYILVVAIILAIIIVPKIIASQNSGNGPSGPSAPSVTTITELNRPYQGSILRITATGIRTIIDPFRSRIVSIKFIIENISKDVIRVIDGTDITGYIDDAATSEVFPTGYPDFVLKRIDPGKRAEGYYSSPCSKDAKTVEIYIEDGAYNGKYAVFAFDIPPVE